MNGTDLLAEFRRSRSETAFAELVRRYTNLVFSVGKRRLGNTSQAEEITQVVFIRLAKAVPQLRDDAELAGWLHRTTVHASIDLWRSEARRRRREELAAAMPSATHDLTAWEDVAPLLDDALNQLNDSDRQTILLRFFDGKPMRDLGEALGVSEDAAKMRVSRAVERLRRELAGKGAACGAVALEEMLADRSVEAAPCQLVAALAVMKFGMVAGPTGAGGLLGVAAQLVKTKLAVTVAAVALLGTVGWLWHNSRNSVAPAQPGANSATSAATPAAGPAAQAALSDATNEVALGLREPDPLQLLQAVAKARRRVSSGMMELRLTSTHSKDWRVDTNEFRLAAVFDGPKLRFEQSGREYRYTGIGEAAEKQEARIQAERMDRPVAIRAGLLQGFDSISVTTFDGSVLLRYRENDGKPEGTVITSPDKGSYTWIFDPRCLGLTTSPGIHDTIEGCLGYADAQSVRMAGQELLEGILAWRVVVQSKWNDRLEFWLDATRPARVLKHTRGSDSVVSKYGDTSVAIPTEVFMRRVHFGAATSTTRFTWTNGRFNLPVDPATWTLAGLGMQIGTSVSDDRISRGLGYWNGVGLSENPNRRGARAAEPTADPAERRAALEKDPGSADAREAAVWLILNTPDGPEVEWAAEVLAHEHTRDTNLLALCEGLERLRPRCATNLLEALLRDNPSAGIRASACFFLATLQKEQAKWGQNRPALAEADRLFARVVNEFSVTGPIGAELARRARPELDELRHLQIGQSAPETTGEDLEGRPIRLGDYRGKVVVLAFWCCGYSEASEHRKLIEQMAGKPFALIGISGDNQISRARSAVSEQEVTWPCLFERGAGPVHTRWNVRKWLTTVVLDRNGVIRHRDLRGRELVEAVEALLRD